MSIIELRGATKSFEADGTTVRALDDVSLSIREGEIFGIIGYSGAGKSTLLRLINGLETVTSGHVFVDGTDVAVLGERELRAVRSRIGMVFQQFNLFRSRTAAGNVAFPLVAAGWKKEQRDRRVAEVLDFVGLLDRAHSYPEQLSGGQKQRVGVARALAGSPRILLADELTSALDPETTQDVLALLKRINRELGVTIVLITHEMEVIRAIADRVAVLDDGRVVELGSVFDVFAHPQTSTTKNFVASVLHHRPKPAELDELKKRHRGRIVTAAVVDDGSLGRVLSRAADHDVSFNLLYGGVSTLQNRSFGSFTIEFVGENDAVDHVIDQLRAVSDSVEVA